MYLLVFVTLLISIIGLYANVLGLQAARIFSGQNSIAQTMLTWHVTAAGAVSNTEWKASDWSNAAEIGAAGCSLTGATSAPSVCKYWSSTGYTTIPVAISNSSTILPGAPPICSSSATKPCSFLLPTGYSMVPYTFNSIAYRTSTGQNYVLTYVAPPAAAATPISLPGAPAPVASSQLISITISDLMNQLVHSGLPVTAYGTVATIGGSNYLVTTPINTGSGPQIVQYPMPTGATVAVGSVGIITAN